MTKKETTSIQDLMTVIKILEVSSIAYWPDGGWGERLSFFCNTGPKFQMGADGLAAIHDPNRVLSPSPSAEKVRPMPLLSSTGPYINSICDCWSAALEAAFFYSRFRRLELHSQSVITRIRIAAE